MNIKYFIIIIEIYILINSQDGDSFFTGQLAYLKPYNLKDALDKIHEKMGHKGKLTEYVSVPYEFNLSQNYPNPFNPITTIKYSIPNNTNVTLKVYDILGRIVKTLINEYKEAGNYTVNFDGTNISSEIYLYRIEAGKYSASKKMVLIK